MSFPVFGRPFGGRFGRGFGRGGMASSPVYIARFQFTVAASAPLPTPYVEDPYSLTLVQNDGQFSKSGGKLVFPAQASFAWDDQKGFVNMNRVSGRFIGGQLLFTSGHNLWRIGFESTAAAAGALDEFIAFSNTAQVSSPSIVLFILSDSILFDVGVLLLATGALYLQRVGPGNTYAVHYITRTNSTVGGAMAFQNGSTNGNLDNFDAVDLGDSRFISAYNMATGYSAAPTTGTIIATLDESVIEFTWTPVALEVLEIRWKRVDDNNCWLLRCDQAAGTLKLYQVVSGVETEFNAGQTATWTAAVAKRIVIKHFATRVQSFVADVLKHDYVGAASSVFGLTAKVAGFTNGANFASMPYRLPVGDVGFSNPSTYFLAYGDSKTWGQGDTGVNGTNGYPPLLATNTGLIEMLPRSNGSGLTVTLAQAQVDANLAFNSGFSPAYVLFNFGANDTGAMPTQANYLLNYGYMIDAAHFKWPNARIGIALVGKQGQDANCATLNGWAASIIAARSYCFTGPDETIILKGSDNYATYTVDGTHPNHAGYILMAAAWQSTMGL